MSPTHSPKQTPWTPGPWTFASDSMTGAVWAEKEFIASVFPNAPDGCDGSSEYPQLAEMQANAHLIAAAPELYEALRQLVGNAEIARYQLDDPEGMVSSALWDTIQQAHTVMAKARPSNKGEG